MAVFAALHGDAAVYDNVVDAVGLLAGVNEILVAAQIFSVNYKNIRRHSLTQKSAVGYADGLDRHLGCGRWSVRIKGESAPIIGRVCMDSAMVDISNIRGVEVGDTVTIFSAERGNTLEDMARVLDTISYEIMTSISQRVKRVYTER